MAGEYAAKTDVPVSRSRDEIERTLKRFGASDFAYRSRDDGLVQIAFEIKGLRVSMRMQLPARNDFTFDSRMRLRPETAIARDWEQACRQRWRTLGNAIKAKLAMVDDGISSLEHEFLSNILLPSGQTYGDFAVPQIAEVYRTHAMPPMLPGAEGPPSTRVIELPARAG